MKKADCILVSFDEGRDDEIPILIVGRKHFRKEVDIINAFQGDEARELYNRLITRKEKEV